MITSMQPTKKILIIEDEPALVQLMEETVRSEYPYILCWDRGGSKAVHVSELTKPDLIIINLTLAVESGLDLIRQLKEKPHLKDIPVMVYTDKGEVETIDTAMGLGASCFMTKDRSIDEVLAEVGCHVHQ